MSLTETDVLYHHQSSRPCTHFLCLELSSLLCGSLYGALQCCATRMPRPSQPLLSRDRSGQLRKLSKSPISGRYSGIRAKSREDQRRTGYRPQHNEENP
ncbi:hypothetical protein BC834DRAFT_852746 [Gloeopeniophorella convolvens]|nr:hypothetical protein BC834DRAFT_852746 [Gloeopeniophorella convolvens]